MTPSARAEPALPDAIADISKNKEFCNWACCALQIVLDGSLDFGSLTGPVKISKMARLSNFTQHPVPFSVILEGRMPITVTPTSGELGPFGTETSTQSLQVELRATFPESIQGRLKIVAEGAELQDIHLFSDVTAQVGTAGQDGALMLHLLSWPQTASSLRAM